MEDNNVNQTPVESQAPSQPVQQPVAQAQPPVQPTDVSAPQASESVAPVQPQTAPEEGLSPELQKEQDELNAKIANYGSSVEVKAGVSGQSIDYSQYVGRKAKIASVTIGTKPKFWKDGKKSSVPVGMTPCFVVTTEPLDRIDLGDGNFRDVTVEAKLNAYFVDDGTGKEVLSFSKDDKGMAWKFCRRLGITNPMNAVGMTVEIEKQLNDDPEDTKCWLQMRI